ncbi:MAG: UPF0079 ATP-binding protein [Candidatus Peregrinibacteria bacterium Greene0416_62]|nr:MAG: UPF0079 ATP-binding protein [Candidatus Peregrinibacteria bacterium Greene0416_62]TSC98133.1 MAG: UPF0079 ATP-binding protein [Candidatus Peregrinibacteria bacterium Greene1014_49]
MSEIINIWLTNAESTVSCGKALARTLYAFPVDILLSGELGAGKTTFLQGFAKGLSITQKIVSPTFALEQRYPTPYSLRPTDPDCTLQITELIHIDLYRLSQKQSRQLLYATEDHTGIRCIEWPEHAAMDTKAPHIHVNFSEDGKSRIATILFDDIALPSRSQIESWRREMLLPTHIARHCDAVADFAEELGSILLKRGIPLRPMLLRRCAEVHDLLRFLDFRLGGFAGQESHTAKQLRLWADIRRRYPTLKHEPACAAFLSERGYPAPAEVVKVHGLELPSPPRSTIEQQILFYADKRVKVDERVTLGERFEDFRKRYSNGKRSEDGEKWYREAKGVEEELFPEGCPL